MLSYNLPRTLSKSELLIDSLRGWETSLLSQICFPGDPLALALFSWVRHNKSVPLPPEPENVEDKRGGMCLKLYKMLGNGEVLCFSTELQLLVYEMRLVSSSVL